MDIGKTQRGFDKGTFKDNAGQECSVQVSSVGIQLWVGIDEPWVDRFNPQTRVWEKLTVPDLVSGPPGSVVSGGRMLLDRKQVRALSKQLNTWLRTGNLG